MNRQISMKELIDSFTGKQEKKGSPPERGAAFDNSVVIAYAHLPTIRCRHRDNWF